MAFVGRSEKCRGGTPSPWWARLLLAYGAITLLALVLMVAGLLYDAFLSTRNIVNVLRQNTMVGLVALGATFVIVVGGVDLSVGSLVALGGIVAAKLSWY